MTESLVWLAQARYPDRKLIVWTSSLASLRSPRELFTPQGVAAGHERAILGTLARTTLGDIIYSIGFLAGSGSYGPLEPTASTPIRPLARPLPESWDGLFLSTGKPFAFLHLRREPLTTENVWLYLPRVARAIGYQQALARWPNVYDAFFFTASMAPATPRP
jgi:erythromycin esterase-like protein